MDSRIVTLGQFVASNGRRLRSVCAILFVCILHYAGLGQCGQEIIINEGFENVDPPCGAVPPGGLINGSFNMGCMTGWDAAWGSPSVCSAFPNSGNYYACLGSNNEAIFQNVSIITGDPYNLSFYYRGILGFNGTLQVYLANGLVNQPISNSGNPPLTIDPSWQSLGNFPGNVVQWTFVSVDFVPSDPINNQLVFIDVPTGTLDLAIDDVSLINVDTTIIDIDGEINCVDQTYGTFQFQLSISNSPPGYVPTSWSWDFGDGQVGTGETGINTYDSYGEYTVCVQVCNDTCACSPIICTDVLYDLCTCNCEPDTEPPQILSIQPDILTFACISEVPDPPDLQIADLCDTIPEIIFSESFSGTDCEQIISRQWIVTDHCGNSSSIEQTIYVKDSIPPVFLDLPFQQETNCLDLNTQLDQWINDNGGATALDNCGALSWSADYPSPPYTPCEPIPVTFIVTDACENSSTAEAYFTIIDDLSPHILQPAQNLISICESVELSDIQQWLLVNGDATATDTCGSLTWSNDFSGVVLPDSTRVIFTVADDCQNSVSDTAWIIQQYESDTIFQTQTTCDPLLTGLDTLIEQFGLCTLWVVTETNLVSSPITEITIDICQPSAQPDDTLLLQNQYGCDSIVVTHYFNTWVPAQYQEIYSCDSGEVGIDTLLFPGPVCDTVIYLTTIYAPSDLTFNTVFVCDSSLAGLDSISYQNQWGCDSLLITEYIYLPAPIVYESFDICGSGVSFVDTIWVPGIPCDTMAIQNFEFLGTDETTIENFICEVAQTDTIVTVLTGTDGCDSLVTTIFLYSGIDTSYQTFLTCDPDQAGIEVDVFPGPYCDTVVVTEWLLSPFLMSLDTIWSCNLSVEQIDTTFLQSSNGCDSLAILYTLPDSIQFDIIVTDETCAGFADGSIEAVEVITGTPPYQYQLAGLGTYTTPLLSDLSPGIYELIVSDAQNCRDTISSISVQSGDSLIISIQLAGQINTGQVVELMISSNEPIVSWNWMAEDPMSCTTCPSPLLGPLTIDQNISVQTASALGCTAMAEMLIALIKPSSVFVPNVFSPNQDGINDVFTVFSGETIFIESLEIYSRWGEILFVAENFRSDEPTGQWDGTFRDQSVNPGVYIYQIKYTDADGKSKSISGDVTLIR